MNFNFLSRLKTIMNNNFGIQEKKPEPLTVSPQGSEEQARTQRQSYEQRGGRVPLSTNPEMARQQLTSFGQGRGAEPQFTGPVSSGQVLGQQFPSVAQYGIPEPSQQISNLIMQYFPPEQWLNAARVAFGESGYNPSTVGPTNDWGVFQINPYYQRENLARSEFGYNNQDLLDAEKNIRFAAWLQGQQGWRPWYAAQKIGLW